MRVRISKERLKVVEELEALSRNAREKFSIPWAIPID